MFLNLKLYRIGIKSSKINSLDVVWGQSENPVGMLC